ncbi:hypothetical protein HDE_09377 [Halotydeus destructor]|nr:hypothetical protein HDE_09377 [Halotydeus destructor]
MAWISSCLDFFRTNLVFRCNLVELCKECEALKGSTESKLSLNQLPKGVLIGIFKCLEIPSLVKLERVSKQFFRIVSKTFLELEHITRQDVAATELNGEARLNFDPVSFINRFGSSLKTLPFEMFVPLLENGQCDTSYCKQLAWRFPEISDVGAVDEDTIDWLLVFVNALSWKCKLRELYVCCDLQPAHMFDRTILTMLKLKISVIISQCNQFDKLIVRLSTHSFDTLEPYLLKDRSVSDFGKLVVELSSSVNRLVLIDKAVEALMQYTSLGPVNLQTLELVHPESDFLSDAEVYKVCRFAPQVRTISIQADVTALKHLIALAELEDIQFVTKYDDGQMRDLRSSDSDSVRKFFETRGPFLKKAMFALVDCRQHVPILSWLSKYCLNLKVLALTLHGHQNLELLKFPNLRRFIFAIFEVSEAQLRMLLRNNPELQFLGLICVTTEALETSRLYFETQAKSPERTIRCLTVHLDVDKRTASVLGVANGIPVHRFSF